MSPQAHFLAIHGINTDLVDAAWPWRFAAYVDRCKLDAHVETEHYKAGPHPRLNTYLVNPRVAKALANRVLLRREILGAAPVHLIAHSNGADVAVRVAERLAKAKVRVETLILIGAAIHSDIEKSGLRSLSDHGFLGKAVAYYSPIDPVIRYLQTFPGAYGSLGARGFEHPAKQRVGFHVDGYTDAPPFADFVSRRFENFGHSEYFSPAWRDATFATALSDMGYDVAPY
jgi:pimeloyl-ACP methyl ester carboxylesterase